jgi:DNA-binding NarL/FixJ family response regulator
MNPPTENQVKSSEPLLLVAAALAGMGEGAAGPAVLDLPRVEPHPKTRVLVVEDHPFVREGIVRMLNRQADLSCCGESETVAATPAAVANGRPDLILLDLNLKDGHSLDLIGPLCRDFPNVPILVLSQCDDVGTAERALRAGARGYVLKQDATEELLGAIRDALRGKFYVSPALASQLLYKLIRS